MMENTLVELEFDVQKCPLGAALSLSISFSLL